MEAQPGNHFASVRACIPAVRSFGLSFDFTELALMLFKHSIVVGKSVIDGLNINSTLPTIALLETMNPPNDPPEHFQHQDRFPEISVRVGL